MSTTFLPVFTLGDLFLVEFRQDHKENDTVEIIYKDEQELAC